MPVTGCHPQKPRNWHLPRNKSKESSPQKRAKPTALFCISRKVQQAFATFLQKGRFLCACGKWPKVLSKCVFQTLFWKVTKKRVWKGRRPRQSHCPQGADLDKALSVASSASNSEVDESGYSAHQCVTGRQPRLLGSLIARKPIPPALSQASTWRDFECRIALQITTKEAMTRLHCSKRLRSALLGRTRGIPSSHDLQPGEIAYFYLKKMRNTDPSQRGRDILKQWHGPAGCGVG